jgi:archaea-specific RecJ-like exonuclease
MKEKFNQKKGKDHGKHGGFNKYMEGKGGGHSHAPAASMNLGEVNASQKGMRFNIRGMVDRIVQTGGPTIFHVSDGTGMLALKAFEGAGVRSYPEVEIGDVIRSLVTVEEYNGELEGEVSTIVKTI